MPNVVKEFQGEYRFLSNFWILKHPVKLDEISFPTTEHAYAFRKADYLINLRPGVKEAIVKAISPQDAKRLAKGTTNPEWRQKSLGIMLDLLRQKFTLNEHLRAKLLATGDAKLIEGNRWHDNFWGVCECVRCLHSTKAENNLGKLLMQVREELQHSCPIQSGTTLTI